MCWLTRSNYGQWRRAARKCGNRSPSTGAPNELSLSRFDRRNYAPGKKRARLRALAIQARNSTCTSGFTRIEIHLLAARITPVPMFDLPTKNAYQKRLPKCISPIRLSVRLPNLRRYAALHEKASPSTVLYSNQKAGQSLQLQKPSTSFKISMPLSTLIGKPSNVHSLPRVEAHCKRLLICSTFSGRLIKPVLFFV